MSWKGPALRAAGAVVVIALLIGGLYQLRGTLLASPKFSARRPEVDLTDATKHLPPDIAHQVRAEIQSAVAAKSLYAEDLTEAAYEAAAAQTWVARVHQVSKRPDGTVEVVADYRRPFALVRSDRAWVDVLVVVDVEGVVLPLRADENLRRKFLTIRGVASEPPRPGQRWRAADLRDGIEAIKLLQGRSYRDDISFVDVCNHNRRLDPMGSHVRLWAQAGHGRPTEIRLGRMPSGSDDYCTDPAVRMRWLDEIVAAAGGHLAGVHKAIELRYAKPYVIDY